MALYRGLRTESLLDAVLVRTPPVFPGPISRNAQARDSSHRSPKIPGDQAGRPACFKPLKQALALQASRTIPGPRWAAGLHVSAPVYAETPGAPIRQNADVGARARSPQAGLPGNHAMNSSASTPAGATAGGTGCGHRGVEVYNPTLPATTLRAHVPRINAGKPPGVLLGSLR